MKRIRCLFKKSSSGGFTLVEMVVSVALLAILLAGMMLFVSPIVRSFNDNMTDLTAENVATTIEEYISRSVRNANQVAVFSYINESDLSTGSYKALIDEMVKFCLEVNKDSKGTILPTGKEKYLLKCISLRYDTSSGKYYLCNEKVNQSNGAFESLSLNDKKVFSDCLYKDLYLTVDIKKTKNDDFGSTDTSIYNAGEEYRSDALDIKICAYRDADRKSKAFEGSGIAELRNIKGMLSQDATAYSSTYFMKMIPDNPNPTDNSELSFADSTDGNRDIFIYYVVRRLTTVTT